jgi:hypothetical protein
LRIGPPTNIAFVNETEDKASVPEAAADRMAGNIEGLAPAITAAIATFFTVHCLAPGSMSFLETMSVGFLFVSASMASTRASVGRTIGA